jgi:hypothetical protein
VNSTLQRFGGAFGVAVATSVFTANGSLSSPAAFIAGFRPGLAVVAGLALLGGLAAMGVAQPPVPAIGSERGSSAGTDHPGGATAPAT